MPKVIGLFQRIKKRLAILWYRIWNKFLRAVVLWSIMNVILLVFGSIVMDKLAQATRAIVEHVCSDCLKNDLVSYFSYYIILFVVINIIAWYYNHQKVTKRDAEYLRKILHSENERLPAVDINELVKRITRLETPDEDVIAYNETVAIISKNITPIISFLDDDIRKETILMVDASWGAGKTTAVLVAINLRRDKQNTIHRYIYESAFKYTGNTGDFGRDIISTLHDTLYEYGLNIRGDLVGVIQNIDFSDSKLFPSLLKIIHCESEDHLTTELINKINSAYHKHITMRNDLLEVVIILDDIDRLQGDDIIKALSLLSVIRRLSFVKIIVPVDSCSVISQLEAQCHIPNVYKIIGKYLPEQKAVKLKSDEEIVEQIVLRKIKSLQENPPADDTEFCAAWAAIIIKLVSDKLHRSLNGEQDLKMQWLGRYRSENIIMGRIPNIPCRTLLENSSNRIDHIVDMVHDDYGKKYQWPEDMKTDVRKFVDVILKPQMRDGTPVIRILTEEEYDELIASWIFDFAREDWPQIDTALRDVLDLILANDFSNLSLNRANQFKQVLGILFPESIEIIRGSKLNYVSVSNT